MKKGDVVVCVNASGMAGDYLHKGCFYVVEKVRETHYAPVPICLTVKGLEKANLWWSGERFLVVGGKK